MLGALRFPRQHASGANRGNQGSRSHWTYDGQTFPNLIKEGLPTIWELPHGGENRNGGYGPLYGMCVVVPGRLAGTCEAIQGL
jgi:hypothetical protein